MRHCVESSKSFYEATFDLKPVIQRLGFELLHIHDLSTLLEHKGLGLDEDCQVFEIGSQRYMQQLLAFDMHLSLLLPWRISVYTRAGATWLGLAGPAPLPAGLAQAPELSRLLQEIEAKLVLIIDESR